jgi:CheY-like chemotaxis protein
MSSLQRPRPLVRDTSALRGLHVLIVDDNPGNRRILGAILRGWEMKPVLADCGEHALEILYSRGARKQIFDLVLIDGQMPGMDGFALAERISTDSILAGPRIMMLSSEEVRRTDAELESLGISKCLVKPIAKYSLMNVFSKTVAVENSLRSCPPINPQAETLPPLHVLVAEDNLINQKVALLLLKKEGLSVNTVSNGSEAVAAWNRESFDLILMDVQMPVMNGYEATREIRRREAGTGRHMPVIALTAHAMKGDREVCLAAGMDDYLSKPIQVQELHKVLARFAMPAERELTLLHDAREITNAAPI